MGERRLWKTSVQPAWSLSRKKSGAAWARRERERISMVELPM